MPRMNAFSLFSRVHRSVEGARGSKHALRRFCRHGALALSFLALISTGTSSPPAPAQGGDPNRKWAASWASSMQGAFVLTPTGGSAYFSDFFNLYYNVQPDLSFAFPNGTTEGAVNQTLRQVVKPDAWGPWVRLRLSNVFGTRPVTFSRVTVGLQAYAGNLVPGTNVSVSFGGRPGVTIPPGERVFSDPVELPLVCQRGEAAVAGRNLAVSLAVAGASGPMSYHAGAMATSYISPPGSGDHTGDLDDSAYPYSTVSWFFLDALDVWAPSDTAVVCALGDSITDGTFSTLNGNDRWSNDLARRLHQRYGDHVSVVNEGIGGNTVQGPGIGPSAEDRLDRDVLALSGLTSVVWLEGINDIGGHGATAAQVIAGLQQVVGRLRAHGITVVGCTITSSLHNEGSYGTLDADGRRRAVNAFIRGHGPGTGFYAAIADMDAATLDPVSGELQAPFVPDSTKGGPGDKLHPNRAGYQAMANTVDLTILAPGHRTP